jgi:Tfp pilus assembly protein PilF
MQPTYASALQNLAWAYFELNDLPDAERTDSVVVRLEPKSGEAALQYAWILERRYGTHAAEAQTARALLLEPKNGAIQAYAGYLARREAHLPDARQHYEAASRLLPNDAAVWAELAATDYLMNDRTAAAAAFATSVRIDGNYVRSRPELMRMWLDVASANAR